ncbi:21402_t:CDS:1, partial [Gigaspora margarita]
WRNYKQRPESLATHVWNDLKIDDYPSDKKFLGVTPSYSYKVNGSNNYGYIDYKGRRLVWHPKSPKLWAKSKKSLLNYRLWDHVEDLLKEQDYRIVN